MTAQYVSPAVSAVGTSGGAATQVVTLANVTTGSAILVAAFTTGTATVSTVADGVNTYARLGSKASATGDIELWASLGITRPSASTAFTPVQYPLAITVTWTASTAFNSACAFSFSGLVTSSVLDTSGNTSGTSTGLSSGAFTPTVGLDSGVALFLGLGGPLTGVPTAPWLPLTSAAMHTAGFGVAVIFELATVSTTVNWTQTTSAAWLGYGAALKAVASSFTQEEPAIVPSQPPMDRTVIPAWVAGSVLEPGLSPSQPYATLGQAWPD